MQYFPLSFIDSDSVFPGNLNTTMTIIYSTGKCIRSVCRRTLFKTIIQNKGIKTSIQEPEILFDTVGSTGVITLNRPKLNIMDYNIVAQLSPILQAWEQSKSRVIIKGNGNVFSAGGDLKWLLTPDCNPTKYAFFTTQANSCYRISKNRIAYFAFLDGVAMGSAVMLIANARYKIATERTIISVPEARIGWFVVASHLLARLNSHLGFYMALTGKRIEGKDAVLSGLATHFIPSARLRELETELCRCNISEIDDILNAHSEELGDFSLAPNIKDIDYCFSANTVEEIIERLSKLNNVWSRETLQMMAPLCPIMLKVILRALQLGRDCNLRQALCMEQRVVYRCVGSYNAEEGLRSLLVEKTDRPNWRPRTLAEVTDDMVDRYFDPLAEEELEIFDEK